MTTLCGPSALWLLAVALVALTVPTVAPPVLPNQPQQYQHEPETLSDIEEKIEVEYNTYLKQVVQMLEKDPKFRQKLENASMEDIKSGKISDELHFVDRNIRSKLDELKRIELGRLQELARREYELSGGRNSHRLAMPSHLDAHNPHTFEVKDLKRLMKQTTKDLEELDRRRREEFKQYEMRKEHNRRESLKAMDEEHRRRAQQEFDEQQQKHRDHPKLHHPGSKPQLEEVWKEEDHMDAQDFDPATFFQMHDLDGDNHWSEQEVEALFLAELNKMYKKGAPEDDMAERVEEMERMREHVINETDVNKDGRVSYEEFLDMTRKQDFNQDPGWQGLDEQQMYNDQEYQEYERHLMEQNMIPQDGSHHYPPGGAPMGYDPGYQQQQYPGGPPYQQQQYPQGVPPPQYQHQQGMPPPHHQQQQQQQYYQPPPPPQQYRPQQGVPQQQQYQQQPGQYQHQPPPNQQQQQQQYQQVPPQQQQYQQVPPQQQQHQQVPPQQQQHQGQQPSQQQQVVVPSLGGTASREPQHKAGDQAKVDAASVASNSALPVAPAAGGVVSDQPVVAPAAPHNA